MHAPQEQPHMPPQEQPRMPPPQQPCTPPQEQPRTPPRSNHTHTPTATMHAPPGATTHAPPVNRMTNWCKNITLPQTSFAGGKNLKALDHNRNPLTSVNNIQEKSNEAAGSAASFLIMILIRNLSYKSE